MCFINAKYCFSSLRTSATFAVNFITAESAKFAETFSIRKFVCLFSLLLLFQTISYSQTNITAAEYFIDVDPGTGNGTAITGFSAGTTIDVSTFNLPTTSLTVGRHVLCMRAKNANSVWGYYECRAFYISGPNAPITPDPPPANITALEYFFDAAPAPGSGTSIPITPGTDITLSTFNIPTTSLATGWHILGIRGRNVNGTWGYYDVRRVYIQPAVVPPVAPTISPIVAFEYSIDTDPGVGSGTFTLPVTPATTIDLVNQNLNVGSLALGTHKLVIRGKNQNNQWGFYEVRNFSVCNQVPTVMDAATAVTTTSFTANWSAAVGATSYQLDVSKDNFATFVTGYNNKTIVALSETISGLTTATAYQYRVRAVSTCASDYVTASVTTLLTLPTAQPSNLNFTSTINSLALTFTAASGSPAGYLVIRKAGSSPTFVPVNNVSYTVDDNAGDSKVAYVGAAPAFLDAGLLSDTDYYYKIYSFNQSGALYSYLTSIAPLQGNRKTLAIEPTSQPTNMQFNSLTHTGFNVTFSGASGSPAGYLVLRKADSAPTAIPQDGTVYTTIVGSDAVVHNSAVTNFSQTGLTQNTEYFYSIYAYNGSGSSLNYRVVSPLQGSQLTLITPPASAPTGLQFPNVTASSISVSYTAAPGSPSGYLVVRKPGLSSTFIPQPNTFYTLGQSLLDGTVAYVGSSLNFVDNLLTANTVYYYDVFAYNQLGSLINYQSVAPLEGSRSTLAAEPAAQPTSIAFSSLATSGFTVSYAAATGSPSGYLAVRSTVATPTFVPTDGTTYSVGAQGSEFISFIGAGSSFTETGLSSNTRYYYAIYSYNGSGVTINYRSTSPLTGDQLTLLVAPTVQPTNITFSSVTSSAMTVGFTAASGVSGYVVVRGSGASPTFVPQNNVTYTNGPQTGGEIVSVGASTSGIINSSLAASTEYVFRVYSYNQSGSQISYNFTAPLAGSKFTFTAEPTAQASGLIFSNPTTNSLTVGFTAATPAPAGYLVIRKAGAAATGLPNDGQAYALSDPIGDGVVAYVGNSLPFVDNGLLAGTTYFYQVFSFNGAGVLTNYLTTVNASNSGSKITVPGKPATPTASLVGQNQFTVNWTATTGADNYRLDVSKDNFVNPVSGFDNLTVSGLAQLVIGLDAGTAYKFRIRAVNTSGTSVNSDEVQQFTIPATPVFSAATLVTQNGFTANWNAIVGATGYLLDISLDNTFLTNNVFVNRAITTTSEIIENLTPGLVYYYRIRSTNSGGFSPYSMVKSQKLVPPNPVAVDATAVLPNSFKAKWNVAQGAVSYLVDVSLGSTNFSSPIFLENVSTTELELAVNQLAAGMTYKYRVRAVNEIAPSGYSNIVSVTTAINNSNPLQILAPIFSSNFSGIATTASTEITGGTAPYTMEFIFRKITGTPFTKRTVTSAGTTYQTSIEDAMLDEIGLEFYFEVNDASGVPKKTVNNFIYRAIPSAGIKIPFTKFGGTKESYELFSIPYDLTRNDAADIFNELGAIDKSKWRLSHYQNRKNVDIGAGLTAIEQGKGYWFNRKENIDVFFSNGTITKANQTTPFVLSLESGWNQIGNPFPFNVDWDDIVALSADKNQIGKLKIFNPEKFTLDDESNNLKVWSGGFVFNSSTQRIELTLPVTLKNTSGGRRATPDQLTSDLSKQDWFIPLRITQSGISNATIGFGMHPEASLSNDQFDEMVVPRFINYVEFYTTHTDFFYPWFTKDVVPSAKSHSWDFGFESNLGGITELQWDNEGLGTNDAKLILFDPHAGVLVDMKKSDHYRFEPVKGQTLSMYYGASEKELSPDINALGAAWPNPFSTETNISFVVKNKESKVVLSVIDMLGKSIYRVVDGVYDAGIYTEKWEGTDLTNQAVAPGLYILRLEINGFTSTIRIIKK
jgi:Fibronectin type III domain